MPVEGRRHPVPRYCLPGEYAPILPGETAPAQRIRQGMPRTGDDMKTTAISSLEALAARIPTGAKLAIPADYSGVAMAATLALIRRGVRGLHLVTVPSSGLQAELLIGAGCVETVETSAISLG